MILSSWTCEDSPCVPFHRAVLGVHQNLCRPAQTHSEDVTQPQQAHIKVSTHWATLSENNALFAGWMMAYATLDPGSPGIPRAPSAPERPWDTLHMQIMTYML